MLIAHPQDPRRFADRYGLAIDVRSLAYANLWLRAPDPHLPEPDLRMWYRRPGCQPGFKIGEPGLWLPLSCAVAFDAFNGDDVTSATSLTYALTCTGTNLGLVCVVVGDSTDKISGVTYNSVSLSLVDKFAADGLWTYAFYLNAPATGAHDVVVSASSSSAFILSCAASYTGVLQSGQPEASAKSSTATGSSHTESVTTLTDNAWTVLCAKAEAGVPAAGTGSTKRGDDGFGGVGVSAIFDSNAPISPAGNNSMTFTAASGANPIGSIILSLAPAGAGVTPARLRFRNVNG